MDVCGESLGVTHDPRMSTIQRTGLDRCARRHYLRARPDGQLARERGESPLF